MIASRKRYVCSQAGGEPTVRILSGVLYARTPGHISALLNHTGIRRMRMATRSVVVSIIALIVLAQTSPAQTAVSLRTTVEALAHDSTAGRATPSVELDKAARYIEKRFRDLGALPLGDDATFFQKYPVIQSVLSEDSTRIIAGATSWTFGKDYFYAGGGGGDPRGEIRAPTVIVTGRVTPENGQQLGVKGKIVVFVSPLNARGAPEDFRSGFALGGAGARAVILPGGRSDSLWKRLRTDRDEIKPSAVAAWPLWWEATRDTSARAFVPLLELWGGRWQRFVESASVDTSALRNADGSPKVTALTTDFLLDFDRLTERVAWPSNVVGLIRGTDPILRNEYIVLTAHYDGLGSAKGRPPGPQSILNGADDNASGVAALIEVAAQLARNKPKRSVIFAAVSGEENGLWGSDFLASRLPVPRTSVIANVNMDMIGRPAADTVYVTGRGRAGVAAQAARAIARAPRGLTILAEAELERRYPGERADERSDHANFRHRGIPSISFFTGWHADYHETTDDADKVNYDALSRITGLIIDATVAIANAR